MGVNRVPAIVFADMDYTWLTAQKQVPEANWRAMDRLREHGIPFVVCTGRSFAAAPAAVVRHAACTHVVGCNGAEISAVRHVGESAQQELLHASLIDHELVLALYEAVQGMDCTFDVFADGVIWSEQARYDAMAHMNINPPTLRFLWEMRTPTSLSVPEILEAYPHVTKLTLFFATDQDAARGRELIAAVGSLTCASGEVRNLEVMAAGTSKASGLTWLCDYLGIPVAQSLAFGDGENDAPMLQAAGCGVAVENAMPAARAVADQFCAACDEGGPGEYVLAIIDT